MYLQNYRWQHNHQLLLTMLLALAVFGCHNYMYMVGYSGTQKWVKKRAAELMDLTEVS